MTNQMSALSKSASYPINDVRHAQKTNQSCDIHFVKEKLNKVTSNDTVKIHRSLIFSIYKDEKGIVKYKFEGIEIHKATQKSNRCMMKRTGFAYSVRCWLDHIRAYLNI